MLRENTKFLFFAAICAFAGMQAGCGQSAQAPANLSGESSLYETKITNKDPGFIDIEFYYDGCSTTKTRGIGSYEFIENAGGCCLRRVEVYRNDVGKKLGCWEMRGEFASCATNTFTFQNGRLVHGTGKGWYCY
jgi:hypothetical protein